MNKGGKDARNRFLATSGPHNRHHMWVVAGSPRSVTDLNPEPAEPLLPWLRTVLCMSGAAWLLMLAIWLLQ